MKLASVGPMQMVLAADESPKADELKPSGAETAQALPPIAASAEGEDPANQDDESFFKFIEFIRREKKKDDERKLRKKPKSLRDRAVAAYRTTAAEEKSWDQIGENFKKAG